MLWLKQIFCDHDFTKEAETRIFENQTDIRPLYTVAIYICNKCLVKKSIKLN